MNGGLQQDGKESLVHSWPAPAWNPWPPFNWMVAQRFPKPAQAEEPICEKRFGGVGLEILPAVVNSDDHLGLAPVHKGIETISALLDSADGIWF